MKNLKLSFAAALFSLATIAVVHPSHAESNAGLKVYGPGGPAPAMREAAQVFEQKTRVPVTITAGPTAAWIESAKQDADLVYSGSETMMSDFVDAMEGRIDSARVEPLYLRPFSILVRPGNPRNIKGLEDLFKPGYRILVVNGAGQNGVWEDAGRKSDIQSVRAPRGNIVAYAKNSALARQAWIDDTSLDAWLIWNIWQVANPTLADVVPIEKDYLIYRDTGIVETARGGENPAARQFVDFLKSPDGAAIFGSGDG